MPELGLLTASGSSAVAEVALLACHLYRDLNSVLGFSRSKGDLTEAAFVALQTSLCAQRESGALPTPEQFFCYFHYLEGLKSANPQIRRYALRLLGNSFLGEPGETERGCAVLVEAGKVPLPGGRWAVPAPDEIDDGTDFVAGTQVAELAEVVRQSNREGWIAADCAIPLRGPAMLAQVEVAKYRSNTAALAGTDIQLGVAEADPFASQTSLAERITATMAMIAACGYEHQREIEVLTRCVVPVVGADFVGGSDIYTFGASYLNLRAGWSNICFADHLIHEAAHQLLHAAQETEPLLLNRHSVGAASPIRSDPRPLYGTFHATFVFLRLTQFFNRLSASALDPSESREVEIRSHRHFLGLLQGLRILAEHARWSDRGRREYDAWAAYARDLRQSVGVPCIELASKLTWDYESPDVSLPLLDQCS